MNRRDRDILNALNPLPGSDQNFFDRASFTILRIRRQRYDQSQANCTQSKIAGVSLRTGSRVINNDPTVKPANLEKVVDAMKKLGYTPDITARTLRGAKSFMIGVTYDNLNAYYIRDLLTGVLSMCQENGYGLQIIPSDSSAPDVIQKLRQNIQYSRLAGLVMSPPLSELPEITNALIEDGTKLALITSGKKASEHELECPTVFFDDFGGHMP